jgi:hypothetical protein
MREDALLNRRLATVLGWSALASLAVLAVLGLWVAPPEAVQRDAQRLMYLHVPAAWLAYLAFGVTALGSALYLWRRTRSPVGDRIAGASAEIGVVFTALTLVLGSLWGRPVWGIWWAWDARLVTTAVLFFLYIGYLALRRIPGPGRPTRCAIAALIAFVDVPIVHLGRLVAHAPPGGDCLQRGHRTDPARWRSPCSGVLAHARLRGFPDRRYRLEALEEGREEASSSGHRRAGRVRGRRRLGRGGRARRLGRAAVMRP